MKMSRTINIFLFLLLSFTTFSQRNMDSLSITQLLDADDYYNSTIELYDRVVKLSNYGSNLTELSEPQKVLYFVENFEVEINNGGFNQFYWNSVGNYTAETYESLKLIKAFKIADIMNVANSVWPNSLIPKDRTERQIIHEKIEEAAESTWEKCDFEFYKYPDNIVKLLWNYIQLNKAAFE